MKTAAATDAPPPRGEGAGLRVLVLNSVLTGGGVDTQTLSQCQALIGQGAAVTLAVSPRARWIDRARAIPGLRVWVLSPRRWLWPLQLAPRLRREAIDVLHAHHGRDYWIALVTRLAARRAAVVVVTRHLMTPLKDKTRRYLRLADRVVAVSDAVLAALRASDPGGTLRLQRIHCGIDTAHFHAHARADADADAAPGRAQRRALGLPDNAWVFAVIGAIHAPDGKGQFHFVRAARQVLARHPDAAFVCAGSGEATPALQAEAQAQGLGDRFVLRPFGDDMDALMQAIDVLVHPAVSSEALGLVILEALSSARPVIASRLDGIPETLQDGVNGLLVPPRDVDALAAAMLRLADDRVLARRLGAQGPAWVAGRFSLACVGQALVQLYRQALAERGGVRG